MYLTRLRESTDLSANFVQFLSLLPLHIYTFTLSLPGEVKHPRVVQVQVQVVKSGRCSHIDCKIHTTQGERIGFRTYQPSSPSMFALLPDPCVPAYCSNIHKSHAYLRYTPNSDSLSLTPFVWEINLFLGIQGASIDIILTTHLIIKFFACEI